MNFLKIQFFLKVTEIDIEGKKVKLDNNWEIAYDKCLLATGGKPKNLPVFEKSWEKYSSKVTLFRNVSLNSICPITESLSKIFYIFPHHDHKYERTEFFHYLSNMERAVTLA